MLCNVMNTSLEMSGLSRKNVQMYLNEWWSLDFVVCRLSPYSVSAHSSACRRWFINAEYCCKHMFRMITYSINAYPVVILMFSQTGTDLLPLRDEGSDKPSATIEPHRKSDVVTIVLPQHMMLLFVATASSN